MRRVRWMVVLVLLAALGGVAGFSARPVRTAHGQFWSTLWFMGRLYDVHVAFNIQARGEDDRGNISIRYFDVEARKLTAVVVSTKVFPIWFPPEGGISFHAELRAPKWDFLIPPFLWADFWAYDDGPNDDFGVIAPISIPLTPTRGEIVIRAFD